MRSADWNIRSRSHTGASVSADQSQTFIELEQHGVRLRHVCSLFADGDIANAVLYQQSTTRERCTFQNRN